MALFRCASGSSGGGATITVTYSSDFYGETVTCSHGTKTYSKVATSSGTLEFSVDEEGTWTISSMRFSDTADVVLNYPAELVSLPNGETVLPTDDIEKWLLCADIKDKSYTTLSEVLADSVTYNALLGDSNACAYMKRSTTWSTDICASQYAMNLLGQYDTACDALLSDSTWLSAIANSTYWESVLNVKVPVMTSDTTPEGEVVYSTDLGGTYAIYKAFDGNTSTAGNVANADNCYFGYHFTSPVRVIKAVITGVDVNQSTGATWQVKGGNDGTTWSDALFTKNVVNGTNETFVFGNTTAYSYYIIYQPSKSGTNTGIGASELQFYGRTTSSEKIHGGNPTYDSFYRIVDGNNVPVTDPSLLDAGTYTIYSNGLAKDPSNLSNDYGKTVRICPNTKEIVVRPDNTLYWYGSNCASGGFVNENINATSQSMTNNDTSISVTVTNGAMHCYSQRAFNTAHCTKLLGHIDVTGSGNGSGGFLSSPMKTGNPSSNEYGRYTSTMPFSGVGDVTLTNTGDVYTHIYVSLGNITATQVTYALWYE